jgi:DNA invertase Pin-like site-specific DNA recombinase
MGCEIVHVYKDGFSGAIRPFCTMFAEFERPMIQERVCAGLRRARERENERGRLYAVWRESEFGAAYFSRPF